MCEKHVHRKPEVSYGRLIRVGLVGPKPRTKVVGDGQRVKIPVPLIDRFKAKGGRRRVSGAYPLDMVRP